MAAKKHSKKVTKKKLKRAQKKQKKTSKKRVLKPSAKTKKLAKIKKVAGISGKNRKPAGAKKIKKMKEEKMPQVDKNETLKKLLVQKREQIVREAKSEISKYIKGETRQLVDTALDDGDWSIVDLSEDVSLRQLATHKETLTKIDAALGKLAEGTYGICEDCGEDISKERLKVLPFAIYCRDCQEKIEQLEAIEKERP